MRKNQKLYVAANFSLRDSLIYGVIKSQGKAWGDQKWFFYNLLLIFFVLFLSSFAQAIDVPKLQGYVNDYANMISPSAEAELENKLKAFELTDSTQIVILTIPSLE